MRLILLVGFFYLAAIAESKADIYHYNNIVPGTKPTQMGGAYTALSDDPSGIAYNPAGIAFVNCNEISGSVQGFYTNTDTYRKAIGDQDFKETASGGFSPFLGSVFKGDNYLKNSVAGFALYDFDSLNKLQNTLIKDQPLGGDTIHRYYRTVHASAATSVKAGALALRINKRFALGLALGLLTVDEIYQSYQESENYKTESGSIVNWVEQQNLNEKVAVKALEPLIGLLYKPSSRLSFGLALRYPWLLSETASSDSSVSKIRVDTNDVILSKNREKEVRAETSSNLIHALPFALRLGFALKPITRATLAFDYNYHHSATATSSRYDRRAVHNFHLGAEYQLLTQVYLRSGFFTNYDARPRLQEGRSDQEDHIDYWGLAFFGEYGLKQSRFAVGVIYQNGKGQAQKVQASSEQQEVQGSHLAFALAISHVINDDKKAAYLPKP